VDDLKNRKVLPIKAHDRIRDRISARGNMKAVVRENQEMPGPRSGKP